MGAHACQVRVIARGNVTRVVVKGVVDESADFSAFGRLEGRVSVDVRGVRRINSFGVRAWLDAMSSISPGADVSFYCCPPAVVDQINMIPGFLGPAKMVSFYAPMVCEECDEQVDHLCHTEECRNNGGRLPSVSCPCCGAPMELDDVEDQYVGFMRDGDVRS